MGDNEKKVNEDFFKLVESGRLVLGCCWESIFLIDKSDHRETHLGDLDGMVDIGLIGEDDSWAMTGREVILLWRDGKVMTIDRPELKCVEGMKLLGGDLVELAIDTMNLNNNRSVWELNVKTLELRKVPEK